MNCGNFPFGETFHSEQTMSETYECVEWAWLNDTDIDHARNETGFKFSKGRIPWAGNGSQADHKRNNYAIQTRKLSHSIARSAGKSNRINFLEGNFPQDYLYLGIVIIIIHVSSNHIIPKTFSLVPEVKSAEKPLH